jgi:hypothetical protein
LWDEDVWERSSGRTMNSSERVSLLGILSFLFFSCLSSSLPSAHGVADAETTPVFHDHPPPQSSILISAAALRSLKDQWNRITQTTGIVPCPHGRQDGSDVFRSSSKEGWSCCVFLCWFPIRDCQCFAGYHHDRSLCLCFPSVVEPIFKSSPVSLVGGGSFSDSLGPSAPLRPPAG